MSCSSTVRIADGPRPASYGRRRVGGTPARRRSSALNAQGPLQVYGGHGLHVGGRRAPVPERAWLLDTDFGRGRNMPTQSRRRLCHDARHGKTGGPTGIRSSTTSTAPGAARAMGGPERLERQRTGGRLDARARVELLVDPGTFVELGTLVGSVHRGRAGGAGRRARRGARPGRRAPGARRRRGLHGDGRLDRPRHDRQAPAPRRAREQERVPFVMLLEGAGERDAERVRAARPRTERPPDAGRAVGLVPTVCVVMGRRPGTAP